MLLYTKSPYFQKLLEGLSGAMMIFNVDGDMYATNEAAVRLLGSSRNECLDMTVQKIFSCFEGGKEFRRFVGCFKEEKEDGPVDVVFNRNDGTRLYLTMTKTILTEYDKAFGYMLSVVDNTRIREMHDREMSIVSENAKLHQKHAERLRQLSEGVAHQIRNPLMVISGFSGLLRRKTSDRGLAEFFDGIEENTNRLACIVESVAEYTALSGISVSEVQLLTLLEDVAYQWRQARERGAEEVEFEFGELDVIIQADAAALAMAFKELFSNSHDFMREGRAAIAMRATEGDFGVSVTVADDGAGIDTVHKEFLFDPFFSTKSVGVGMGLCKVERIMREHGGRVTIESNKAGGTTVTLFFPSGLQRRRAGLSK